MNAAGVMSIEDYNKFGIAHFGSVRYVIVGPRDDNGATLAVRVGEKCDDDGNYACDRVCLDSEHPTMIIAVEPREIGHGYAFNPITEEEGEWLA